MNTKSSFDHLLSLLTIRQKLLLGFTAILALFIFTVVTTLINTSSNQRKVSYMNTEIQPSVVAAMELQNQIKHASTSLGFYILTKEELHKKSYENHLASIDTALASLKATQLATKDQTIQEATTKLDKLTSRFKAFKSIMYELVNSYEKNYKAVGFASQHMNPINQELMQAVSTMILSETSEELTDRRKHLLMALEDMRYSWSNAVGNVRTFLLYGNEEILHNVRMFTDNVGDTLKRVQEQKDILTFEQEELLPLVEELRKKWVANFDQLVDVHKGEAARTDALYIRTKIGPMLSEIDSILNEMLQYQRGIMSDTSEELIADSEATNQMIVALLVLSIAVFSVICWLATRAISAPIKDAVAAMDDIAAGYGDLTRRLDESGKDEISALGSGFNRFVTKVQTILSEVRSSTNSLTMAADEMSNVTAESSETIQRQKQETDHIASSITEMSITSQEVLRHAVAVADANQNVDTQTSDGSRVVSQAIDSVQTLDDETVNLTQLMEKLASEIQDIGQVLEVIQNITEQTNLLALNAAIEAARAGEQGRGFSVVADEVRTLAQRTTSSTHEIKAKIESIQTDTKNVLESATQNKAIARSTVDLAKEAGNSLEAIAQAVLEATDKATQIATMAQQQSAVADEISKNVENITLMADHTSQASSQISGGSHEQQKLCESLAQMISQFKL